jgi:hypothetical protein
MCTGYFISSAIVAWVLTFWAVLLLTLYYKGRLIHKCLIAGIFPSLLLLGDMLAPILITYPIAPVISGNLLLLCIFFILYFIHKDERHDSLHETPVTSYLAAMNHPAPVADLSAAAESLNRLRHDMKHHIVTLLNLAEQEDCPAIVSYLYSMEDDINAATTYVFTNNASIDSIVNAMIAKADRCHCLMNVDVMLPENMHLPFSEINRILGNILENAIEAAAVSDEKKITLSIYLQKGVLYIDLGNTYSDIPSWQSGKLVTHKGGGKHHGIGLDSVASMVKRLNGILEYQHDEKIFRVLIMLYIE